MPNDMSKEQAAAQRKHADTIKAERAVMNFLGCSRSQARELTGGFQNATIQQANNRGTAPVPAVVEFNLAQRPGSKLDLHPFRQAGDGQEAGGKGSSGGELTGVTMLIYDPDDGFKLYENCILNGTLGTEVT